MDSREIKKCQGKKLSLNNNLRRIQSKLTKAKSKLTLHELIQHQQHIQAIEKEYEEAHISIYQNEGTKEDLQASEYEVFKDLCSDLDDDLQERINAANDEIKEEEKLIKEEEKREEKLIKEEEKREEKLIKEEEKRHRLSSLKQLLSRTKYKMKIFIQELEDPEFPSSISKEIMEKYENEISSLVHDYESQFNALTDLSSVDEGSSELQNYHEFTDEIAKAKRKLFSCYIISSTQSADHAISRSGSVPHKPKVPDIIIPQFGYDTQEWLPFKALFEQHIHHNDSYTPAEKLTFLKGYLVGDAQNLVRGFISTDPNYMAAYELLCHRYHNPREILSSLIQKVLAERKIEKPSYYTLIKICDNFNTYIRSFKGLEQPIEGLADSFLVIILQTKLDAETYRLWTEKSSPNKMPKIAELLEFMETRAMSIKQLLPEKPQLKQRSKFNTNFKENYQKEPENRYNLKHSFTAQDQSNKRIQGAIQSNSSHRPYQNSRTPTCKICNVQHYHKQCTVLQKANVKERKKILTQHGICINCLSSSHLIEKCNRASYCFHCKERHHTLVHMDPIQKDVPPVQSTSHSLSSHFSDHDQQILLYTCVINVKTITGQILRCRAIMDTGSQCSFISRSCYDRLGFIGTHRDVQISGIERDIPMKSTKEIAVQFGAHFEHMCPYETKLLLLESFQKRIPNVTGHISDLQRIQHLNLADPQFYISSQVDILLGNEVCSKLMGGMQQTFGDLNTMETALGVLIGGRMNAKKCHTNVVQANFCGERLHKLVEKFWETEKIPEVAVRSVEDRVCEQKYIQTTTRDETGRYIVRLPFRQEIPSLGTSYPNACAQYYNLERRLKKDPSLQKQYTANMNEFIERGHMTLISHTQNQLSQSPPVFLPHHPVIREDHTTTKVRTVFNGSAKTSNGQSLNDQLFVGPTMQVGLFSIIARFRGGCIAIISDIEKMYLQILVHPDDRVYQEVLWGRNPETNQIQTYQLNTVTFGTGPSAFLATQTLIQLANDERLNYPVASEAILKSFYVDDFITSTHDIQQAKILIQEMNAIMTKGGFKLRKWATTHPELLTDLHLSSSDNDLIALDENTRIKTLGIYWNPKLDVFQFKLPTNSNENYTKRTVLSFIAKCYDPMGWLTPALVLGKIFLQVLWHLGLEWDQILPPKQAAQWQQLQVQLSNLSSLQIPRWIQHSLNNRIELHGFCDASLKAYAAVIYSRSIDSNGNVYISLLASKTKLVSPKDINIPRLELSGALFLARLYRVVADAMEIPSQHSFLWCDSQIALCWILSTTRIWESYVSNRVHKIHELVPNIFWGYVKGTDNPADYPTKGISPSQLISHPIWWNGPFFIRQNSFTPVPYDPKSSGAPTDIPEEKVLHSLLISTHDSEMSFIRQCSSLSILQHSTALMIRAISRLKSKVKVTGIHPILSAKELDHALLTVIKHIQNIHFQKEIHLLTKGKQIPKGSYLRTLNPFIGPKGLLRVGGRLQNSNLPYDVKHQILLPKNHHILTLLFRYYHNLLLHAGVQTVMYHFRRRFWTASLRSQLTKFIHKCISCFKARPRFVQPLMGNLPSYRITPSLPFLHVGIDFAGPLLIKPFFGRKATTFKVYIALYICMVTKAVHLEAVTGLSSQNFLDSFNRFISRRGIPSDIYTDQGTNFVGANRRLKDLYLMLNRLEDPVIKNLTNSKGFTWHFNPPASPNFGGLWEASVKSVKTHLQRVIGLTVLNFEELTTILNKIEAVLNSRPICPLTADPSDFEILSPGHFTTGRLLIDLPQPSPFNPSSASYVSRWNLLQSMLNKFWQLWENEYISQLQTRPKWQTNPIGPQEGDLVLIKNENTKPLFWKIGRIQTLFFGKDGISRVADVLCSNQEILRRPISKLAILPIHHSSSHPSTPYLPASTGGGECQSNFDKY
jgi:hypothetical protein